MYRNNEDKINLNKVDYQVLEVDDMTAITKDYISLVLVINICAVFLYLVNLI